MRALSFGFVLVLVVLFAFFFDGFPEEGEALSGPLDNPETTAVVSGKEAIADDESRRPVVGVGHGRQAEPENPLTRLSRDFRILAGYSREGLVLFEGPGRLAVVLISESGKLQSMKLFSRNSTFSIPPCAGFWTVGFDSEGILGVPLQPFTQGATVAQEIPVIWSDGFLLDLVDDISGRALSDAEVFYEDTPSQALRDAHAEMALVSGVGSFIPNQALIALRPNPKVRLDSCSSSALGDGTLLVEAAASSGTFWIKVPGYEWGKLGATAVDFHGPNRIELRGAGELVVHVPDAAFASRVKCRIRAFSTSRGATQPYWTEICSLSQEYYSYPDFPAGGVIVQLEEPLGVGYTIRSKFEGELTAGSSIKLELAYLAASEGSSPLSGSFIVEAPAAYECDAEWLILKPEIGRADYRIALTKDEGSAHSFSFGPALVAPGRYVAHIKGTAFHFLVTVSEGPNVEVLFVPDLSERTVSFVGAKTGQPENILALEWWSLVQGSSEFNPNQLHIESDFLMVDSQQVSVMLPSGQVGMNLYLESGLHQELAMSVPRGRAQLDVEILTQYGLTINLFDHSGTQIPYTTTWLSEVTVWDEAGEQVRPRLAMVEGKGQLQFNEAGIYTIISPGYLGRPSCTSAPLEIANAITTLELTLPF